METISDRLRQLRIESNLSQKAVSDAVGINERGLRHYENGERIPRLEQLIALADYFGVSVDYLVGRIDDPKAVYLPTEEADDPQRG